MKDVLNILCLVLAPQAHLKVIGLVLLPSLNASGAFA
jgi:hypothetical protein